MKLQDIIGKKIAVNCTTLEEVIAIRELAIEIEGEDEWLTHSPTVMFDQHKIRGGVCFVYNDSICYMSSASTAQLGYTILPASEFISSNKVEQPETINPDQPTSTRYEQSSNKRMVQTAYIEYCKTYDPQQALQKALDVVAQFEEMVK